MNKIAIHDIDSNPLNQRNAAEFNAEMAAEAAAQIWSGQATVEVKRIEQGYEVVSGFHRLPVMLEVSGRALVRIDGTQEQFYVRRAADGSIVRAD